MVVVFCVRLFAPQGGRHIVLVGVEIWDGRVNRPPRHISPLAVQEWVVGPKTVNFTKLGKINVLQGRVPCTILAKFSEFVGCNIIDPWFGFDGIRSRGSKV